MAKNIVITVIVAIILAAFIVLTGCLPHAKTMKTGGVITPPYGYIDWQNRLNKEH